ncbi:MAG: hypothetical protein KY450_15050, partial [Actinobacteria bacterium]|nr:hypothetical protein [Actinomycetota bacterium]
MLMGDAAAPDEVLQDPLAHRLRLGDHGPALGLGLVDLRLGLTLGLGPDLGRRLLGLLGPAGQQRLGLLVDLGALGGGLPHEAGRLLPRLGQDLGGAVARCVQQPAGLLAQGGIDLLVGGRARRRPGLGR